MKISQKEAKFILIAIPIVQLVVGFVIGLAVGRCSAGNEVPVEGDSPAGYMEDLGEDTVENTEVADTLADANEFVIYPKSMPNFRGQFNDMPDKHMAAIADCGLKQIPKTRKDIKRLRMAEIKTCDLYAVDELTHSVPYLTRGAAGELKQIARRFQALLKENGMPKYKIFVTSVLRTEEDVARLSKSGNVNSSKNSAHCYGTTFDISYVSFVKADNDKRSMNNYELKKVLIETMLEEKQAGHVYVKYERKQPCLHITSRL